jgi:deazaflavin-dependent oxidoreductase (nitroreductase family)
VSWLADVADEPYAYLTTTGRVTGRPHEIEIWFATDGTTVWLLAGGRDDADWVRNLRGHPGVTLRIADRSVAATSRVVGEGTNEDARARDALWRKYAQRPDDLTTWRDTALPVAIDMCAAGDQD